jgi:hypothetical protein
MAKRNIPPSLIPATFEQISLTAGTGVFTLNSTVIADNPCYLYFSVDGGDIRMRHDGSSPTDTTGVLVYNDTDYSWEQFSNPSDLKFALNDTTVAATIDLQAYVYPDGD